MLLGLYIARQGQGNSVEQTLLTAAQKTTSGLRIAAYSQLSAVRNLAKDSRVVEALAANAAGTSPIRNSEEARNALNEYLLQRTGPESPDALPTAIVLYNAQGGVIMATHDLPDEIGQSIEPFGIDDSRYIDIANWPESTRYVAQTVAPVFAIDREEKIGFVSTIVDITPLLKFALGHDPYRDNKPARSDIFQVAYLARNGSMTVSRLDSESKPGGSVLTERARLDPRISEAILTDKENSGTIRPVWFARTGSINDSFVAYDRLFDGENFYILVSRSAADVYWIIYMSGLAALAGSAILMAFLCLNAYRNVHNNIVRPVLLLNEGAQIIGQGDLELKLKIGTGDEIEELASSFNKMALALKRNIRQLEESEEKYRSLVTSMRDGIFQTDPGGIIGFMNPAGVEVFGFAQFNDALGQNIREMFLETEDLERFNTALREAGFVERSRVWMKRQDGRSICVELSGNLMHDDERAVIGVEGIFRDVTKSIRLEHEARDRAERLSAINQIANVINSSLEAGRLYESLVVEIKKLVDFDYAELALLKESGHAFVARQLWPEHGGEVDDREYSVVDDGICSAWVAQRRECLLVGDLSEDGAAFAGQFPSETKSCVCIPLYATGRIIGTLNLGSNRASVFSKHDVEVLEQVAPHVAVAIRNAHLLENLQLSLEEVTRAREKLHEANEELKTLDEMKTNLLSNVSHELRTPLVAVMGYTDMIFNGKVGPVNEVQKDYLGISLRNIEKLVTLIENLLDFSRLHRGAETLVFGAFDLTECARLSMQIVQPVADGREIELILAAPQDPVLVEGDKGKMGQVFNNLLSNAVKFNQKGGTVTVEIRRADASVDVEVRDTGIGIPEEALDKVFTRFYQYDSSSTRKYGGTGIGLSIAQDIARLHGSRITATSEQGKGSTFRFSLPLRESRRRENGDGGFEEGTPPGTRLLVELVTSDRALSMQVRTLLMAEGMDVIHALSTGHAVTLAHRHSPDCAIVDVESKGNGNEILDTMLGDSVSQDLPIIMLTSDEELYTQYESQVASRIKRTFRKSALLSAIHYAVGRAIGVTEPPGHRILCVDDDNEILMFMVRCLDAEGYDVAHCASGEDAIPLLAGKEFGLVLLDIAMPGMDGWETCRRIKSDPATAAISVHMVTAKPIESSSPQFRRSGANGYLLKPFHAEDLLELVQGLPLRRVTKEM